MTTRNLTQKMLEEGESIRVAFVKSAHDLETIGRHVAAMLNTHGGSVLAGTQTLDPGISSQHAQAVRERAHILLGHAKIALGGTNIVGECSELLLVRL